MFTNHIVARLGLVLLSVFATETTSGQSTNTPKATIDQSVNRLVWDLSKAPVSESLFVALESIRRDLEILSTTDPSRGHAIDFRLILSGFIDDYDDFQFASLVRSNHADVSLFELSRLKALEKLERMKNVGAYFTKISVLITPENKFLQDWATRTSKFCQEAYELALKASVRLGLEQ